MNSVFRKVFGVVIGVIVAVVTISLVEMLGHHFYPMPEGLDPVNDYPRFEAYLATVPLAAKAFVVGAWTLGAFAGGCVAILVAQRARPNMMAAFVAGFVMLGIAINAFMLPSQWPMAVVGAALVVAAAWLATRVTGGGGAPAAATPG